ncbi:MAG TPA: nucleotide exchange factor GrpE [Candidatus Levybacteria bacterium]|nr:nucleotide exchange factor GrpE [Candidatus Levybacteria bacterium]
MDDKTQKPKVEENLDEIEELDDELDEEEEKLASEQREQAGLKERITSLEDQLKRAVADYRNLENRVREERLEFVKYANRSLIEQLLPAFDTLLLAEKYTKDENLKITAKHILEVLKVAGIEKVETIGKKYDPITMEAVEVIEGDKEKVLEETQPGFTIYGKIIRPARVKVGGKDTVKE